MNPTYYGDNNMFANSSNQGGKGNSWMGKASQGAGIGSSLGSLFGMGQGKNPADAANPYYNQIPDILKQYMSPYVNMGQQAMPQLMEQYQKLLQDPTAMMNQIGSGYQQSPGYQFNVDQATNYANHAAAAGGMQGSPQEQQQLAQTVSGIANQDYYNYLNQGLGQYNQGLAGMGSMNQMGFNAASGLSGDLARSLMNQGNLAYAGQNNQNQSQGGFWGSLGGLAGAAYPFSF